MEKRHQIQPTSPVNFGSTSTFNVPRLGHFIKGLSLHIKVPKLTPTSGTFAAWTNTFGFAFIEQIEMLIGGVTVDRKFGIEMDIDDELSTDVCK